MKTLSSTEKIICGTCKKYHRSAADNTNQRGGFLQKEKASAPFSPVFHRSAKGRMPKLWHTDSVLALSVFALQIHLSQRERPWHSGKVSGLPAKLAVSPEALPSGELARERLRGRSAAGKYPLSLCCAKPAPPRGRLMAMPETLPPPPKAPPERKDFPRSGGRCHRR